MKIKTRDASGNVNGWVLPIWNSRESEYRPDQVYVTVVLPFSAKGPHLHKKRTGYFACILGAVQVITRTDGRYEVHSLNQGNAGTPLLVPPGTACELRNVEDFPAFVLNMPSPSWSADEPDENEVADWTPQCPNG